MKKILFLTLAAALAGCASVKVAMYDKNIHYPATDPKSIEVFQQKPETRKFIEIGEVTVDGASDMTQAEKIFRIKAAEYGGDAVYVFKTIDQSRAYATPHECHFSDVLYYPHGFRSSYEPYRYSGYSYFQNYYYCYGYNDTQAVTFLTVVGIVIKYTE